jgi:hypothetical protein
MVEANPSLARSPRQAQRQTERMRIAVRVEAQRRAKEEVKARLRREGRVKLSECHRATIARSYNVSHMTISRLVGVTFLQ